MVKRKKSSADFLRKRGNTKRKIDQVAILQSSEERIFGRYNLSKLDGETNDWEVIANLFKNLHTKSSGVYFPLKKRSLCRSKGVINLWEHSRRRMLRDAKLFLESERVKLTVICFEHRRRENAGKISNVYVIVFQNERKVKHKKPEAVGSISRKARQNEARNVSGPRFCCHFGSFSLWLH